MKITIEIEMEDGNTSYLNAVLAEIIACHAVTANTYRETADQITTCAAGNCGHSWTLTVEEDD